MKGILLVNTGTPATNSRKDVKSFVRSMLLDPMVMTVPDWFRPILVNGIIIPLRQFASTSKYNLIWGNDAKVSPLMRHMQDLKEGLQDEDLLVDVCMRYGEPSVAKTFEKMNEVDNLSELIVLPLFPHYAESSYETAIAEVKKVYEEGERAYDLRIIEPYFSDEHYIEALVKSIKPYLKEEFDMLVFSYHSLPISHIESACAKGKEFDYIFQTKETTRLVCDALELDNTKVRQAYSSAMGSKWLKPSLDSVIEDLGREKMKRILVVSPGFSVDNLETLYDVGVQATDIFKKAGGEELVMIPCLNSNESWVEAIRKMII